MKKMRVDQLLVEQGLCPSRTQAQAWILAGLVFRGTDRVEKAGQQLPVDTPLEVKGVSKYVSRGGDKLEGALRDLNVPVAGARVVDLGASTGGFTDCLLQNGAERVFAVDVGRGQLAARLCQDPRVENRERTNARYLQASDFSVPIDLVVVDASFISLELLLPSVARILPPGGRLLALIKPQFEAGREAVTAGRGVIRDADVRQATIEKVVAAARRFGVEPIADAPCRVPGPKGNVEHFLHAQRTDAPAPPLPVEDDAPRSVSP